jgi:hypothetical protein
MPNSTVYDEADLFFDEATYGEYLGDLLDISILLKSMWKNGEKAWLVKGV